MNAKPLNMFQGGEDLPLFSQTPIVVHSAPFNPQPHDKQASFATCQICLDTGTVVLQTGARIPCVCKYAEGDALKRRLIVQNELQREPATTWKQAEAELAEQYPKCEVCDTPLDAKNRDEMQPDLCEKCAQASQDAFEEHEEQVAAEIAEEEKAESVEELVREAATAFPLNERWMAGVQALTLEDLLNEILGIQRPTAVLKIIAELRSIAHLGHSQPAELAGQFGLTLNRAKKLLAAIELGRRTNNAPRTEYPCIKSPGDAAELLRDMGELEQEQMRVLILNTKNRVVQITTVYQGSLHTTVIRINELFREAIRCNAAAVIVAHNHPSGDPTPSPEDVAVTREISQAGKLLDIDVLDHVVIGSGGRFVSLKERGLGFA